MKIKTKILADRLVALFSGWPGVECVSLNEAAMPDTLDPYFALVLDVFFSAPIPPPEERRGLYGEDVTAFENSSHHLKDRFLIGDMPVRVEYKSIAQIEELASYADTRADSLWLIKDSGTYGFYRLTQGEVLYRRSGWIDKVRERLLAAQDDFWERLRDVNQSKMEHFLNDLGAALYQGDDFFSLISAAGFIKHACLTLFCVNRRFEPSHRAYGAQVLELPELPESFAAQLEIFLSHREGGASAERRYTLAKLIARGIISLP
ncbi:MAG: DUF4037 domain-containing protein [Spirochaetaceae bacterium]|jgi:hypothetical protein|nr:DUF4037 domain-containing protein [Spirochaetaceae bacterium]